MKHNQIILAGVIRSEPKILIGTERVFAQFRVITINGYRTGGRQIEAKAFDAPMVHTSNPEIVDIAKTLEIGDFVIIKGAITTSLIIRKPMCPHCKKRQQYPGVLTYVSPASITITDKKLAVTPAGEFDKNKATERLKELKEISNVLTVMGVVCRDPQPYKTTAKHKRRMTAYQLAIKRKLRIIGELDDSTADFPWVKSYGKISMNDGLYIKKGTYMFIDGWLRARKFIRKAKCADCGEEIQWTDYSHDIVPYASEYIKNYNSPESITRDDTAKYNTKRIEVETEDSIDVDADMPKEDKTIAERILDEINNALKNSADEIEEDSEKINREDENDEVFSLSSLAKNKKV